MAVQRSSRKLRARLAPLANAAISAVAVGLLKTLRLINRKAMANVGAALVRTIGPWMPEQRIGRAQLAAAFPEKSPGEIEAILRGVWDNLGRVGAEFAHIDRITTRDPAAPGPAEIDYDQATFDRFLALRDDCKPALIFTAHLANWELSAQVATRYGLDTVVLFRRPNLGGAADAVMKLRAGSMGTLISTGLDAPVKLADALLAGRHVAMLVDQYYVRGVDVTFFGQRTKANPLIARLARQIDCPIHGVRMVRLPDHRFRIEMTPAIEPVRDAEGKLDVGATMQAITGVIEGWVREHPEQWLWLHRRWRGD